MQPLYEDKYGILQLVSGEPLGASVQPLCGNKKIDPESASWLTFFKRRYLFRINACKLYRAYVIKNTTVCRSKNRHQDKLVKLRCS